jgi:pyridoxamine 5'-phosphate oxidase
MGIPELDNPIDLFSQWYDEVQSCEALSEPTAMTLATSDEQGMPDARIVLLKGHDNRGFVFFTNLLSTKGQQLQKNPKAALCFYWMPLDKQVRIRGALEPVSTEEAEAYFGSRPRQSQIGAWASKQSQVLEGRWDLEKRVALYAAKYAIGTVPRPEFWSGFRLVPSVMEFWLKGNFRLHERLQYRRQTDNSWQREWLFP